MSKKKVLIIENNKEIRENTAEILELNNYKVLSAKTGSTGFDLAKQFLPDLILCDIMKPETESRIFFKHASQDETILQIPIILFSEHSSSSEVGQSMLFSNSFLLIEPFEEKSLLRVVDQSLKQRRFSD